VPSSVPSVPVTVTWVASPTLTSFACVGVRVAVAWKLPELMILMASVAEPAVTDFPTERFTAATVPLIGLVSWASDKFCWALIRDALAESIEAWSLASCCALSEAVDPPLAVVEPPPVELLPEGELPPEVELPPEGELLAAGAEAGLDFVAAPELAVVEVDPEPLGLDPPELGLPEPLPAFPAAPVPDPDDEDDELSSLARAVSAFAKAFWSVWTCC
jgi:hypothetical protein